MNQTACWVCAFFSLSFHFYSESINMLYFNKTAEDIWCRSNLDSLADKNNRYKLVKNFNLSFLL